MDNNMCIRGMDSKFDRIIWQTFENDIQITKKVVPSGNKHSENSAVKFPIAM